MIEENKKRMIIISFCLIGILAVASFLTTSIYWEGGFPSGEFRLKVYDSEGEPIKGAALYVYHKRTREKSYGYPLDNYIAQKDLLSNDSGVITTYRSMGGVQFGGHAWLLFWVIPMGAKAPEYYCEIKAEGFKPIKFDIRQLFELPSNIYYRKDLPKTVHHLDGKEIVLPIYNHTFILTRQDRRL